MKCNGDAGPGRPAPLVYTVAAAPASSASHVTLLRHTKALIQGYVWHSSSIGEERWRGHVDMHECRSRRSPDF